MQEETMAVAGQCWASAQTPGKPRNVNIHSPHWLTASYDGQLPYPTAPVAHHTWPNTESQEVIAHGLQTAEQMMGQLPLQRHSKGRWRFFLIFQSWPWERGGKERYQSICHLWAILYISKVASMLLFEEGLKERACEGPKEVMVQK